MKRFTFYLLLMVIGTGLYAQQAMHFDDYRPKQAPVDLTDDHFVENYAPLLRSGGSGPVSVIPVGTAYNIYTILLDEQNQVSYDPDLNSVAVVHRQDDGTTGGSGGLCFYSSTDGGATFGGQYVVTPDFNAGTSGDATGNRYPSIGIYNPLSNTDPANAYAIMTGPALSATTGSWGNQFRHSAKLTDGSDVSEVYFASSAALTDFHPYGLSQNKGTGEMWSMSTYFTGGIDDYEFFYIHRGVFNTTTNSVDWSTAYIIDPDYKIDIDSTNVSGYGWNIAFGPDGTTGYAVFLGSENSSVFQGIQPIVYKSSDSGSSWSRLPDFDFRTLSAFTDYLVPAGCGDQIPFFTSVDVAVDENNDLRIFSEVLPRSTCSEDSLYFIWTGPATTGLFALSTSDGTAWDAALVDSVLTEDGAIGTVAHGNRTQIATTADGSKVFYSWAKSDDLLVATNDLPDMYIRGYDVSDDEWTYSLNATAGSAVEGIIYFPSLAPIVLETGSEKDYEVAAMFAEPGADDLSAPQFYYIKGAGFDETDFGALAPAATAGFTWADAMWSGEVDFTNTSVNATDYIWDFGDASPLNSSINPTHAYAASGTYNVCLTASNLAGSDMACEDIQVVNVGVEDLVLGAAIDIFPTPTNGEVNLQINSNSFRTATVEVYSIIGELVYRADLDLISSTAHQFDLSEAADGQYIVKIQADDASATRQITIAR